MAKPLFCKRLLNNLGLQPLIDNHLAKQLVFFLQLLHMRHHRGIHPTKPGALAAKQRTADTKFSAQVWNPEPCLGLDDHELPEYFQNLQTDRT
jgi:hypothetical protein